MEKTYGQFCPIAAGLDVLGDRWVLLICRELNLGDQRFTDLRGALPGIAPNLLSERLKSLQADGLVITAELPPPAARTVYRLTERGREVLPVLGAIARFGAGLVHGEAPSKFGALRAAHAFLGPWRVRVDAHMHARLVLRNHRSTAVNVEADREVDIVLDGLNTSIVPPFGTPDLLVTTIVDHLVRARRTDKNLVATFVGPGNTRTLFLEVFRLSNQTPPTKRRATPNQ